MDSTTTSSPPGDDAADGGGGGDIRVVLERLVTAEPSACDQRQLDELVTGIGRARSWLDSLEVAVAARARQFADTGTGDPVSDVLSGHGRRSQRSAERTTDRADVCDEMPAVNDALAKGDLSGEHVDTLAAAAAALTPAQRGELATHASELAAIGAQSSPEEFGRTCRRRVRDIVRDTDGGNLNERTRRDRCVRQWIDRETGAGKTLITLDAETHAKIWAAINAAVAAAKAAKQDDGLTFDQLQVDALVALITGAQSLDRRTPDVSVLIDLDTLIDGLHDHSTCETSSGEPLEPDAVRRMACDAGIVPIVLGGNGVPLDAGRTRRLATREQRLALRAMYRSCAMPGCQRPFDHCQIHHVDEWRRDLGPTDLDRLLPVCNEHHHLVHEGGWRLELQPDRALTVTRPDGTIAFTGRTDINATAAA